uniref:Myosin motor domain-containing protein n=2 Tax=Odontella aurita TaxID=265563 RepID=A0A7S4HQR0_9STRA|mmetsp:Transcript_13597/g.39662  ORF Transcript_13597/g.39662 Transcript_13597/m.39662 type:complete len:990 (+) Transcript_13597:111-3080(+)
MARTTVSKGTKVFVRDDFYDWLPAELAQPIEEGDLTALVYITLPDDWDSNTVSPRQPCLLRGSIIEETGMVARRVKLADYPGGELPLQNIDANTGNTLGKSDMADLPHLHEAAILYNLKDRHKINIPYTRVGDIVVAVNPFQWIDGLYSDKKRHSYAHKLVWNVEAEDYSNRQDILEGYFDRLDHDPHVYETACNSYLGLLLDKRDQAILVSGESGAGKTESVKLVMAHLATIENTHDQATVRGSNVRSEIVSKISESNPLFEAFGNAQTARNDNSSRFGKLTKLHFQVPPGAEQVTIRGKVVPFPVLAGSSFETYLLEKSRVAVHDEGERSYHFFYQLLAAPNEDKKQYWDGLDGASEDSFRYIGASGTIENQSDVEDWEETKVALDLFGFKSGKLRALVRAVCAVLQLGNLTFDPDSSGEDGSIISSVEELKKLSTLMGISTEDLSEALTTRPLKTFREEITVQLAPAAAKEGCDALAKEIYAQLFQVIVESINEATVPSSDVVESLGIHSISILDMFGFECFEMNRFEQLCINYANERIQHKYASDTFLQLKDEYEAEEIDIFDFSAVDNSEVLSLVEGRTGLINILNEECIRPKGNDESFVYKIKTIHKETGCLVDDRLHSPNEFSIMHFAGVVTYNSTCFVSRNSDKLPHNVLTCVASSDNEFISERLQRLASEDTISQSNIRGLSRKRSATIMSKFKKQLIALMSGIKESRTRYIRCIKPNSSKQPLVMEHQMAMRQLASAGLVTAITVSREAFPDNLPYDVVYDRFHILLPIESKLDSRKDIREKALILLECKLQGRERIVGGHVIAPFACGKTKVFFRSGSLEVLESERLGLYSAKASILQRWARKFLAEKRYRAFENTAIILQSKWRCKMSRKSYLQHLSAATVIQCWGRRRMASSEAIQLRQLKAATQIQSMCVIISSLFLIIHPFGSVFVNSPYLFSFPSSFPPSGGECKDQKKCCSNQTTLWTYFNALQKQLLVGIR